MKQFLIAVAAASLLSMGASAQTGAEASGSASTNTSVQAGQTNANVNSTSSADAAANAHRRGSNGNAGSENSSAASVNGAAVNTNSSGSLAAGTTIPATLSKPIDARKAKSGDQVVAKTTQDVRSDSGVVIPRGSRLIGHVTDAKAKAKGDSESALGIAFDQAVLKNGQQIPLNASIRALAASANSASAGTGDDNFGSASNSSLGSDVSASAPRAGGGLLGGAGNAVGGATSAVGSTAGGAVNGIGNTAAGVGADAGGTLSGATRGAAGQLTSQSQGVVGLRGLSLSSASSNSTSGSVITSTGKNVKLDSGTQMLLQVNQ
jgi:type IV secretory pathway VirB10-like protein